ncbi:RCC1 domain-containing protein 1 isoform X2 [Amia ocellicauda]|uniref:RCC1 domain-containing protein 1 isoform X2 n=1 Tax=Amia ocellicauda TaxID=2972642 RepID=UPI0034642890
MPWFGFGFNAFGQIQPVSLKLHDTEPGLTSSDADTVRVLLPVRLTGCAGDHETPEQRLGGNEDQNPGKEGGKEGGKPCPLIKASWSRRAALAQGGDGHICLSGFGANPANQKGCSHVSGSEGCQDALISEKCMTLAFTDRVECWDVEGMEVKPVWKMEHSSVDKAGFSSALPLVPGGYVTQSPPFYRPLSPELRACSLALGTDHAVLLSATGTVYTWGSGSHGQLGHGGLDSQAEPQAVEALWGLPMGGVAAGGWHSVCVSAGGDLYVWGWNESGQLGLPSRALRAELQLRVPDSTSGTQEQGDTSEVFISIQAFPALVDLPQGSEVTRVGCGSRHTAAVTCEGDLYTWGWGNYGQLGQGAASSSDRPVRVQYFPDGQLCVVDVVCGSWNTFVWAIHGDAALS